MIDATFLPVIDNRQLCSLFCTGATIVIRVGASISGSSGYALLIASLVCTF